MTLFQDRIDAGEKLARKLVQYTGRKDVIVLALPRGGVPVGFEAAKALNAPMDIFPVRKLGAPGQEELAMGAIAPGDVRVLNKEVIRYGDISDEVIEQAVKKENRELKRRLLEYRGDRPFPDLRERCVILVDDGLATGASMRAAVKAVKRMEPARVVVAVPTAAPETCAEFESEVDEIVCVETPRPFGAVGACYEDFSQITDQEVREFLGEAEKSLPRA